MSNATIVALVALVVVGLVNSRWRLKSPQSERYKLSGQNGGGEGVRKGFGRGKEGVRKG